MSKYQSKKSSFKFNFLKYGPDSIVEHPFIEILIRFAGKSEDWYHIEKDLAEMLLHLKNQPFTIARLSDDKTHFIEMLKSDLNKKGIFESDCTDYVVCMNHDIDY
jgi:hypothetical protein